MRPPACDGIAKMEEGWIMLDILLGLAELVDIFVLIVLLAVMTGLERYSSRREVRFCLVT